MTTPQQLITYPAGPVTPVGAYHIGADKIPQISYISYDGSTVFYLMGGYAIADRTAPEAITLTDIKGVQTPFTSISQKGATQDGATYITSLYDPLQIELTVMAHGRNPEYTRQVVSAWAGAWDAKQPGQLLWYTHSAGLWWANVRLDQAATDPLANIRTLRQKFVWKAINYDAFWQSYDDVGPLGSSLAQPGAFASDFTTPTGGQIL